jgi:aryl sulfotransferase
MSDDVVPERPVPFPTPTRVYENHHLDSPRWKRFATRPGDILITTAYKSGTTWMQTIVANLLFHNARIPGPIMDISPWVDMRVRPFDGIVELTGAQQHRRFLKTHLPLDGIPYKKDMQYIYVGRDLRDVFMSLWNHYSGHSEAAYERINDPETLAGDPFPRCPASPLDLWKTWAHRGWFKWENDGYPYWSSTHHAQTWWDFRHLPNILFVHFSDLLTQPAIEVQRIAAFLGIELDRAAEARVLKAMKFDTMKKNADDVLGQAKAFWQGGGQRFLHRGTNGRWREVLDDKELGEYAAMVERTLTPECARWLEEGRTALVDAANA